MTEQALKEEAEALAKDIVKQSKNHSLNKDIEGLIAAALYEGIATRLAQRYWSDKLLPKWIPVSEWLPPVGDKVLVRIDQFITVARFEKTFYPYYYEGYGNLKKGHVIDGWMPLPEITKE